MVAAKPFWERNVKVGDCWVWTGYTSKSGYGSLSRNRGWHDYAHRVAYALTFGGVPEGLVIDHLCRNRSCVNPAHLEAVTLAENTRRGAKSYSGVQTRCKYGHDITDPTNVLTAHNGSHRCRTCKNSVDRHRYRKHDGRWLTCPWCENETAEDREIRDGEDDA